MADTAPIQHSAGHHSIMEYLSGARLKGGLFAVIAMLMILTGALACGDTGQNVAAPPQQLPVAPAPPILAPPTLTPDSGQGDDSGQEVNLLSRPFMRCVPPSPQPTTCATDSADSQTCTSMQPTATPVMLLSNFPTGQPVQVGPRGTDQVGIEIWTGNIEILPSSSNSWIAVWDLNVSNISRSASYEFWGGFVSYVYEVKHRDGLQEVGTWVLSIGAMQEAERINPSLIFGYLDNFFEEEYIIEPGQTAYIRLATYIPGPEVIRIAYVLDPVGEDKNQNILLWSTETEPCPYGVLLTDSGSLSAELGGSVRLTRWPVDTGIVVRGFGCTEEFTGIRSPDCSGSTPWWHNGIDIALPSGSPYYETLPDGGLVNYAGSDTAGVDCSDLPGSEVPHTGLGQYVLQTGVINSHVVTLWGGHLSTTRVTGGSTTTFEQELGLTGSTGCSTAPHLHFAVAVDGIFVDPMLVLPALP